MIRPVLVVLAMSVALSSCTNPEMDKKFADLEARVKVIEDKGGAVGAAGQKPAAPPVNDEEEQAAGELFKAASAAVESMKYDEARAKLVELKDKYPNTRAAKASKRLDSELAVVGKDVPPDLKVAKWFQGKTDFKSGKATLVIFFEEWCPHCIREVPRLEGTFAKYKDKGLNMVGLTKVTKGATEEKVAAFVKDNKVTYPIGKEEGTATSELFGVQGIPAAAVVKDGKIVWRGHPAKLTDQMIEGWIGG